MSGVPQRDINTYRDTKEIQRGIRLPQGDENRLRGETKAPQKDTKQLQGDTKESINVSFNLGGQLYRKGWVASFVSRVYPVACYHNKQYEEATFCLKGRTCKTLDSTRHILMFVVGAGQIHQSTERRSMMTWEPKESALERDSTVDFFHKLNLWSWMFDFTSGGCESLFGTNSQRESSPECFSISVFRVPSGCVASSVGVV